MRISLAFIILLGVFVSHGFTPKLNAQNIENNIVISGLIFEDVNYGGGKGRNYEIAKKEAADFAIIEIANARVELYTDNGVFVNAVNTDSVGRYRINVESPGRYMVRVVGESIKSTRGNVYSPVLTYRVDGIDEPNDAGRRKVGGEVPHVKDAIANYKEVSIEKLLIDKQQVINNVVRLDVSSHLYNIDFGFNFNTVVSTEDFDEKEPLHQGTLRTVLANISSFPSDFISQNRQDNYYGLDPSVAKEVVIFMIPVANDPLGRFPDANYNNIDSTLTCFIKGGALAINGALVCDARMQFGLQKHRPAFIIVDGKKDALLLSKKASHSTIAGFVFSGQSNGKGLCIEASNCLIEHCFFGTDVYGNKPYPNALGIDITGKGNKVHHCVIAANNVGGIKVSKQSSDNVIEANIIGCSANQKTLLLNESYAILVSGGNENRVGGFDEEEINTIAYGNKKGVIVKGKASDNAILGNTMIGIAENRIIYQMTDSEVNPINDRLDLDEGPNGLQNHPILERVIKKEDEIEVSYSLDLPEGVYRIEFFDEQYIGDDTSEIKSVLFNTNYITHDGAGTQNYAVVFSNTNRSITTLSATATRIFDGDVNGATSRHAPSFALMIDTTFRITGILFEDVNYGGGEGRSLVEAKKEAINFPSIGIANARVELYNESGAFLDFIKTNKAGKYVFIGLQKGRYIVRPVSNTIQSIRGSRRTPILTYRSDGANEAKGTGRKKVGGELPYEADAPTNATNLTVHELNKSDMEEVNNRLLVAIENISKDQQNFGFSFNTVVNTRGTASKESGIGGSLFFVVNNVNGLTTAGIRQTGLNNFEGINPSVKKEVIVFMIPSKKDVLQRPADPNCNGRCGIDLGAKTIVLNKPIILNPYNSSIRQSIDPKLELKTRARAAIIVSDKGDHSVIAGVHLGGADSAAVIIDGDFVELKSCNIGVTGKGNNQEANNVGVSISGSYNRIGGIGSYDDANVIAGNKLDGLRLTTNAAYNTIAYNIIGTSATQRTKRANGGFGVILNKESTNKLIGNLILNNQKGDIKQWNNSN